MTQVEANSSSAPSPAKQKSKLRKFLVWGGMLVLLGGLLLEWSAKTACDSTLEGLQETLHVKKEIPLSDLKQHIRGWAVQGEEGTDARHVVILSWPTLFRQHKLRLGVRGTDQVYFAEAYDLGGGSPIAATPNPLREKPMGLPAGYENVVALTSAEISSSPILSSNLLRELIRQGLLIAAEEELQLATLDGSVQSIPMDANPRSFPFNLKIASESNPDPMKKYEIPAELVTQLEISRPTTDGKPFRTTEMTLTIYGKNRIERLAQSVAAMSRGPFVDAWKKAGYQKSIEKNEAVPAANVDDRMDVVSQFAILRDVHSQIRSNGASAELVGKLVCAYANLGNLTDVHWSAASKAFKARALIYAERLIATSGETPFSLAHRAYALALTGRHATGLQAASSAKQAKGQAAPDWLPTIVAYCEFNSPALESTTGPRTELAQYLKLRLIDTTADADREECLKQIQRCLKRNPICFRAAEAMGEIRSLGPHRSLTEEIYIESWPHVYSKLTTIPQIPSGVLTLIETADVANIQDPQLEFEIRGKLLDELKKAATNDRKPGVPSWSILEHMLREVSFLQAFHTIYARTVMLGTRGDHTLVDLKPIYRDHASAELLETFVGDDVKSRDLLNKYVANVNPTVCDTALMPLVEYLMRVAPHLINNLVTPINLHRDEIYEDATRALLLGSSSAKLIEISPNCPQFIAATIVFKDFELRAPEWEQQYAQAPVVLNAIAAQYAYKNRPADAIRCYKKSIALSPSYSSYEKLAAVYKSQDDLENWQESLERALELPSFGLEAGKLQMEIALALMHKGEWKKAAPYAQAAAETGSSWGLKTAARCAEGLGNWKQAESLTRAMSIRYEGIDWYFWCARTGRGDIEQAKATAAAYWVSLSEPLGFDATRQLAARQILEDKTANARETYSNAASHGDVQAALFAAILADERAELSVRDAMLDIAETKGGDDECNIEFLNQIKGVLSGEERGKWNPQDFERMVVVTQEGQAPALYYFAARFLGNHGEQKLADEYMQCAATCFDINRVACAMANHALREADKPIGETRLHNLPDAIAPIDRALRKAKVAMKNPMNSAADVEKLFDKAIELREDFVPSRLQRGMFREEHRNYKGAMADYEEAIRLDPRSYAGHANLAWILATCPIDEIRNGPKALEHAKLAANQRFYRSRQSLEVLAAAHAELGDFAEALNLHKGTERLRDFRIHNHGQQSSYSAGKPYRDVPVDLLKIKNEQP